MPVAASTSTPEPAPARRQASADAARALALLRAGRPREAWLLADALCRSFASADGYLLRAAALTALGEAAAAAKDMALAALADPNSTAANRALLSSDDRRLRRAAATRLLRAGDATARESGFRSLADSGFACVGALDLVDGRLRGQLGWKGAARLALTLRIDSGALSINIDAQAGAAPSGFDHGARLMLPVPPGASFVGLQAGLAPTLFDPPVHLAEAVSTPAAGDVAEGRALLIVIPVYDDRDATQQCFAALLDALPQTLPARIVAIDDVVPDRRIAADLRVLARAGRIELISNPVNLGFAASVNRGLALRRANEDVLLLNADTLVPSGAIDRLAAHAGVGIGTITPLSNNGEDTSFPLRGRPNPLPDQAGVIRLDAIAAARNAGVAVPLPNGIGFCLYITRQAIETAAPLSTAFGRGYFEDVDFCLRTAEAGLANVCAANVYVGHAGGRSFGPEKALLVARNRRRLAMRHPGYLEAVRRFEREDPLRTALGRIEREMVRTGQPFDLVLLPESAPEPVVRAVVDALTSPAARLVVARWRGAPDAPILSLTATDGDAPQNIEIDTTGSNPVATLAAALSGLPIGNATAVLVGPPPSWLDAIGSSARHFAMLTPDPADLPVARATKSGDLLIVEPSAALTIALAKRTETQRSLPGRIVVASKAPEGVPATGALVFTGFIPPAEFDDWLSRLAPAAVLHASRAWGAADPRTAMWAGTGMAVARFGGEAPAPHLSLDPATADMAAANRLLLWFSALAQPVRLLAANR